MTTYLLFFYTDIYGLSASAAAILFIVARLADVVESLLIGVMIDHTHSKWGKSRPFFPLVRLAVRIVCRADLRHPAIRCPRKTYLGIRDLPGPGFLLHRG